MSAATSRDAAIDAAADAGLPGQPPVTSSVDAGSVPGLPITQGWTVLTASSDTRTSYVSAAGNDAWDGLSPDFVRGTSGPKLTINAGRTLLRDGSPDWLMLRRGDKFTGGLGGWNRSGRSVTEPMLISSYGSATARPVVSGCVASARKLTFRPSVQPLADAVLFQRVVHARVERAAHL